MGPENPPRLRERIRTSWWYRIARGAVLLYLALSVIAMPRAPVGFWGLPNKQHYFSYHPDEIFLLLPSFWFAKGDWNPHFFNYGTLYIYLVGIPAVLFGKVPPAAQFPTGLESLYEMGRCVTALLGIGTVLGLYLALRRANFALAALSAVFLTLCPLHIVNSGYATVDVPATFWLTLAFWLALWGADRPSAGRGALAGLAVGLAAATKYNAALFIVAAMLAPLLVRPAKWRWSWLGAGLAGAVIGFIIGCPFFWPRDFVNGVLFEAKHAAEGGTLAFVGTGSGWVYHLLHGLPVGLGYPLLAAAVLGVPMAIALPSRPLRLSLLWVVFYLAVIGFGKERFIRYLVPLTPFLCVLATGPFLWLGSLPGGGGGRDGERTTGSLRVRSGPAFASLRMTTGRRWASWAAVALAAGVVALTGVYAFAQSKGCFLARDPRDPAWGRISLVFAKEQPRFTVGLVQAPWYFHPPVSPYNAGAFSAPWFERWNAEHGNPVVITGWNADRLRTARPDVFFLSDLESQDLLRLRDPTATAFVAALGEIYPRREEFAREPCVGGWLAPPRSWAPPDWLYPDPHITMYFRAPSKEAQAANG